MKSIFVPFILGCAFMSAQSTGDSSVLDSGLDYNVRYYDLDVEIDLDENFINAHNQITFVPKTNLGIMRLELQKGYSVDSIFYKKQKVDFQRNEGQVWVDFNKYLEADKKQRLTVYYSGKLVEAVNPPWGKDGGFVISKDNQGNPWIATACQGYGAGCWWPGKLGQDDEPEDGMRIVVTAPSNLVAVSNGHRTGPIKLDNGKSKWIWEVQYPINNYAVTLNIADYAHFGWTQEEIDVDFYVLKDSIEKAKKQFKDQVPKILKTFQKFFGTYPFSKDDYKVVETPFLGMEHQSAIAYGNNFENGYLGKDLSGTGIGMNFDYILVHESAHEWFGNSITGKNIRDLWIHESFATYAESVYVEDNFGHEDAMRYLEGYKNKIKNERPIVHTNPDTVSDQDMYFKGALFLNTLRSVVDRDHKWWTILKNFTKYYKYANPSTEDVIAYFEESIPQYDLTNMFNQYLKHNQIPTLIVREKCWGVKYRWKRKDVKNFEMPIEYSLREGKNNFREKTTDKWYRWNRIRGVTIDEVHIETSLFYIEVENQRKCRLYLKEEKLNQKEEQEKNKQKEQ